ncbi:MAG: hypothetical protein IJH52_08105 [Oscillospiraceae bacterium]|nr:hypothetical protein [Oscillospiraceae bacterium]
MKMIPLAKQSKKKQKQYHAQRRGSWGDVSPVTRVEPDRKKYDRSREKQAARRAERAERD